MKIESMTNPNGNKIANQFTIQAENGLYFQSYNTVIAFKPIGGTLQLDKEAWNYSTTTSKYRNIFTGLTTKETEQRIKSGDIELVDLNK